MYKYVSRPRFRQIEQRALVIRLAIFSLVKKNVGRLQAPKHLLLSKPKAVGCAAQSGASNPKRGSEMTTSRRQST